MSIMVYRETPKHIKCSLCNWQILKWRTNKKGKIINGYHKLKEHHMMYHEKELMELIEQLDT